MGGIREFLIRVGTFPRLLRVVAFVLHSAGPCRGDYLLGERMEEMAQPRRDGDEGAPTDPRFAEADDPSRDERLVVASDYRTPVAHPNGSVAAMMDSQRASGRIATAIDLFVGWVQRDPAVALGAALGLGIAVGFVLRRTVLLSTWEMGTWEMGT